MMEDRCASQDDITRTFETLNRELTQALSLYWEIATRILDNSGISVQPPSPSFFSIEKNFFSALFLYSYFKAGIPRNRRVLYAAANQCLRGMVTGCDNLLDNEYKPTLETDLPEAASRFRSILDIMVSDRVLFAILSDACRRDELTPDQVTAASFGSLRALVKSGAQEASEENGAGSILPPQVILETVHHEKTGILFQSPWALPDCIDGPRKKGKPIKQALYRIGMGCQILDDMVDLAMDIRMNRHNYVVSLIQYGKHAEETARLGSFPDSGGPDEENRDAMNRFPYARDHAAAVAIDYLKSGAESLFDPRHHFMVDVAAGFIIRRIGADRFLSQIPN